MQRWSDDNGGQTLTDLGKEPWHPDYIPRPGFPNTSEGRWLSVSLDTIDEVAAKGKKIRFDLTHMEDLSNILKGTGKYTNSVTAGELRYIRDNWGRLQNSVKFYKNNMEVKAPWLE